MLQVSIPELNTAAQILGATSAGRAGDGIRMNVASSNIDTSAPTMTLEIDKPSLRRAQNRISDNFRGAARQNVDCVMGRVTRRTQFAPNGRRRDMRMRADNSKVAQIQQARQKELEQIPQTKQVGLNLNQLNDMRKEQIVDEALDLGIVPKVVPPEPVMRRRMDTGLKKDPFINAVPTPSRKPQDEELKTRGASIAARGSKLLLWAMIGAPTPFPA
jgi:hypothetical protein